MVISSGFSHFIDRFDDNPVYVWIFDFAQDILPTVFDF